MKLTKFKIILPICFVFIICGLVIAWKLSFNNDSDCVNKTIKDYYFKNENIKCVKKIYNKEEQSHKIGEYTITLKESLIDKKSCTGYLLFTINKLKGKPKMDIGGNGGGLTSRISDRFYIELPGSGVNTKQYAYDGNTLYQYICFSYDDDFDGTVNYYDYKKEDLSTPTKHKCYSFNIKLESVANEYNIDKNTKIYISPIGLQLKTDNKISDLDIKITNKEGKNVSLIKIKNGEPKMGSVNIRNRNNEEITYSRIFDDLIDVSSIETISYNNKNYKAE